MTKRVLIVDNNMVSRMMIKEIITAENAQYECIQAASAEKAIEACQTSVFAYITLDVETLGTDYLDLLKQIESHQSDAKMAVVGALLPENFDRKTSEMELVFITKPINVDGIQKFIG